MAQMDYGRIASALVAPRLCSERIPTEPHSTD
jgi:hypothetical protein